MSITEDRTPWPEWYGKCRLTDQERADIARNAFYTIGAQMCSWQPGQCMYPAAAFYARNPIPLPCPRCGQMSRETRGVCDSCRKQERKPQGEAIRLFEPAPSQIPGQMIL